MTVTRQVHLVSRPHGWPTPDDFALVDVIDEGPGVPDDLLPHIFERYTSGRTHEGGLGLGLYIAFRRKPVGPTLAMVYAVVEGVFVGAISQTYHVMFDATGGSVFESIVTQAVLATLCVFGSMLLLYKTGVIKVTDQFRSIVSMMVMGYFVFSLINLGYMMFFDGSPFGFGGTGWLGIGISLFAIGLAAVMLTLDFDNIDKAISAGLPASFAWTLAIGLVITLVWLYLEILRLLAKLQSRE